MRVNPSITSRRHLSWGHSRVAGSPGAVRSAPTDIRRWSSTVDPGFRYLSPITPLVSANAETELAQGRARLESIPTNYSVRSNGNKFSE